MNMSPPPGVVLGVITTALADRAEAKKAVATEGRFNGLSRRAAGRPFYGRLTSSQSNLPSPFPTGFSPRLQASDRNAALDVFSFARQNTGDALSLSRRLAPVVPARREFGRAAS